MFVSVGDGVLDIPYSLHNWKIFSKMKIIQANSLQIVKNRLTIVKISSYASHTRCGTSAPCNLGVIRKDAITYRKAARNANTTQRDVEDAVPYNLLRKDTVPYSLFRKDNIRYSLLREDAVPYSVHNWKIFFEGVDKVSRSSIDPINII